MSADRNVNADRMLNAADMDMFKCSNVQMFKCSKVRVYLGLFGFRGWGGRGKRKGEEDRTLRETVKALGGKRWGGPKCDRIYLQSHFYF